MVKLSKVVDVIKPHIRSPFNYDRDEVSRETALNDDTPSRTKQSFKDECDINTIVKRFGVTGVMPVGIVPPTYELFSDVFDFHTAMNAVASARERFDELPAELRSKFRNDPGEFVAFCSDPKNLDQMREMGLAVPKKEEDTVVVDKKSTVDKKVSTNERDIKKRAVKGAEALEGSDGDFGEE